MAKIITPDILYKFHACPNWPYFETHGTGKKPRRSKLAEMLLRGDIFAEDEALGGGPWEDARAGTTAVRVKRTLQLMRDGAARIRGGVLKHGDLMSEPDLLERSDGMPSELGGWHYVAVDAKNFVDRLHDGHRLQAALHGEVLTQVQGRRPRHGFAVNGQGVRLGTDLDEFAAQFKDALARLRAILAGEKPGPHLNSGCRISPWLKECLAVAEAKSDIALLYSIRHKTAVALRERGVASVRDASVMNVDEIVEPGVELKRRTLERLKLQAEALVEHRHFFRRPIDVGDSPHSGTVPQAALEIHFDIESDPLRQADYLFGFLMRDATGERYEKIVATRPEDEPKLWQVFLHWLEDLPERYVVYHYGDYEVTRLEVLAARYGTSPALSRFQAALFDLNELIKDDVVFPLYFYGLKDIGDYIGFSRGKTVATGGKSVEFYEAWLAKGDKKKLDAIVRYNEDDVRATAALKDWLKREAASQQG